MITDQMDIFRDISHFHEEEKILTAMTVISPDFYIAFKVVT